MREVGTNFTVQGTPSVDEYGGSFEYTTPAPLVELDMVRTVPPSAVEWSPLCIAFCILVNVAALAVLLPKVW